MWIYLLIHTTQSQHKDIRCAFLDEGDANKEANNANKSKPTWDYGRFSVQPTWCIPKEKS